MPTRHKSKPPSHILFYDKHLRELDWKRVKSVEDLKQYDVLEIPRFKGTVQLFSPNASHANTPIILNRAADTAGRTFEAELHIDRLGLKANFLRAVSKQHRMLYVGSA